MDRGQVGQIIACCVGGLEVAGRWAFYNIASRLAPLFDSRPEAIKKLHIPPKKLVSFKKRGIVFGKKWGAYIVRPEWEDGHCIFFARSGEGKSLSWLRNTLEGWQYPALVIDPHGELVKLVRNVRPSIKILNPYDPNTSGYDPFYYARRSDDVASEINLIS